MMPSAYPVIFFFSPPPIHPLSLTHMQNTQPPPPPTVNHFLLISTHCTHYPGILYLACSFSFLSLIAFSLLTDDFESKFNFHSIEDLPPPEEYVHFSKAYPSKLNRGKDSCPPHHQSSQGYVWFWKRSQSFGQSIVTNQEGRRVL